MEKRLIDSDRLRSAVYILNHQKDFKITEIEASEIVLKLYNIEEFMQCNEIESIDELFRRSKNDN